MSVTYGFYNSVNGDRKYDAVQVSSMFAGLILDGVFEAIGTKFEVKATTGLALTVGIGKAWFNNTWTLNDAVLPITAPEAEVLLDRIDAIVIDVDSSESVRANEIKYITGTPASTPTKPTLLHTNTHNQYALCYISRTGGSTAIAQSDITNVVGTTETPYVKALFKTDTPDDNPAIKVVTSVPSSPAANTVYLVYTE